MRAILPGRRPQVRLAGPGRGLCPMAEGSGGSDFGKRSGIAG
ncbi:hypothetical protein NY78_1252 [Desulfovibrio sp. TomC]|nr:hypothetical protein NY78_1252 [Desulfovibrio sp. TomC]